MGFAEGEGSDHQGVDDGVVLEAGEVRGLSQAGNVAAFAGVGGERAEDGWDGGAGSWVGGWGYEDGV